MFFAPGREARRIFCAMLVLVPSRLRSPIFIAAIIENQTILATFVARRGVVPYAAVDGCRGLGLIIISKDKKTKPHTTALRQDDSARGGSALVV